MKKHPNRYHRRTPGAYANGSPQERRGILLLVVLGLLTLFLFVGTAFIASSNQFRTASKTYSKIDARKDLLQSHEDLLDDVLFQLVRDTTNQNSALRFHGLLRDMYGSDGIVVPKPSQVIPGSPTPLPNSANYNSGFAFAGTAAGLGDVTKGQLLEFTLAANYQDAFGKDWLATGVSATSKPYATADNGLSGRTLTFVDRVAQGHTTRIVGFEAATRRVRILNIPAENGNKISTVAFLNNLNGSRILINGRPFNGSGVGYDPNVTSGARLSAAEVIPGMPAQNILPTPLALLPNAPYFDSNAVSVSGIQNFFSSNWNSLNATQKQNVINAVGPTGQGGSDESYDAADFQNMFLAWTSPQPQETVAAVIPTLLADEPPSLGSMVLPSFHRPELVNYWARQNAFLMAGSPVITSALGTDAANAAMLRKVLLRPNWHDHPEFTGSNPEFAATANAGEKLARMIYGPWDVDNDNDGIRDSVWVDFGAPVMMGPNGKLVKPLAAIMVLDMDGRLNVNAHGTIDLAKIPNNTLEFTDDPAPFLNLAGISSSMVPLGQGFGPAEISLLPILDPQTRLSKGRNKDDYLMATPVPEPLPLEPRVTRRILYGGNIIGNSYPGRYAKDEFPGRHKVNPDNNNFEYFDLSTQLKTQGVASFNVQLNRSLFSTTQDYYCRYATGLNDFGQAVSESIGEPNVRIDEDNPYELDLSASGPRGVGTGVDNPYSLGEFERLLRAYDVDAGTLAPRLYELLNGNQTSPNIIDLNNWRTLLTTDSYDTPEPGFQLPDWVSGGVPGVANSGYATVMGRPPVSATFADLIEYRLKVEKLRTPTATINNLIELRKLVAPEMMAGLKLDLNRPLGNGRDDDNNGVVDEPGELEFNDANSNSTLDTGEEAQWFIDETRAGIAASQPIADFENAAYRDTYDRDGSGTIDANEQALNNPTDLLGRINLHNYRRQLMARHLYVLAMSVIDPFVVTTTEGKAKCRHLAQWAINAVDFRDPDNIMTAFEYDENPFDGWGPDGTIDATYPTANAVQLVWGTERPELLITETLAWHDRGVTDESGEKADLDESDSSEAAQVDTTSRDPEAPWDRSFDQRYRPQGAAFIELYNPWAPIPGASADTHAVEGINWSENPDPSFDGSDLGVNLGAMTVIGNSPVWRVAVYQVRNLTKTGKQADGTNEVLPGNDKDPDSSQKELAPSTIDRSIYFTGSDPNFTDDGVAFYNDSAGPLIQSVRPGRYMVIGSGEKTQSGQYLANYGIREGAPYFDHTPRGIILDSNLTSPHSVGLHSSNGDGRDFDTSDETSFIADSSNTFRVATPAESAVSSLLPPVPGSIRQSVSDVVIINHPRRFNVSEPARGYPIDFNGSRFDGVQYGPKFIDVPLDDQRGFDLAGSGGGIGGQADRGGGIGAPPGRKVGLADGETRLSLLRNAAAGGGLAGGGRKSNEGGGVGGKNPAAIRRTIPAFSWVYLQRLANPLMPWNKDTNPYRTIDNMPVNVTAFNGLRIDEQIKESREANPIRFSNNYAIAGFSSLQRGRLDDPFLEFTDVIQENDQAENPDVLGFEMDHAATKLSALNLWAPLRIGKNKGEKLISGYWRNRAGWDQNGLEATMSAQYVTNHNFDGIPDCTLGFLNEPYRYKGPDPGDTNAITKRNSVGVSNYDRVMPYRPFPKIDWNNRPYANPGELMQVPKSPVSKLLSSFSFINADSVKQTEKQERYDGNPQQIQLTTETAESKDGPYGHLLNFFRSDVDQSGKTVAGLYRVLDLVEVPSRYVGTETWLNPKTFGDTTTPNPGPVLNTTDPRYGLQPPFNRIASRREPGRVNINTIAAELVWNALFHGDAKPNPTTDTHAGPSDNDFASSRRGYGNIKDPTVLDKDFPSFFANPFRSTGTVDLVPLANMVRKNGSQILNTDTTLFRTDANKADSAPSGIPFCAASSNQSFRNADRNPYFRYAPISRLSSMTTTRSNVFAVWVTIGFFEVEEFDESNMVDQTILARFGTGAGTLADASTDPLFQRVYSDSYKFTKEDGIDTGEEVRLRQFAIVDRTIPVAFEPGANHNVRETVRLKRKVE